MHERGGSVEAHALLWHSLKRAGRKTRVTPKGTTRFRPRPTASMSVWSALSARGQLPEASGMAAAS